MTPGRAYFDRMPERVHLTRKRGRRSKNLPLYDECGDIFSHRPPEDCKRQCDVAKRYGLEPIDVYRAVYNGAVDSVLDERGGRWVKMTSRTRQWCTRQPGFDYRSWLFTDEEIESAVSMYESGMSARAVAEKIGCSDSSVNKWARQRGKARTISEAMRLRYKKILTNT